MLKNIKNLDNPKMHKTYLDNSVPFKLPQNTHRSTIQMLKSIKLMFTDQSHLVPIKVRQTQNWDIKS